MKLSKQQQHALERIYKDAELTSVPGPSYDLEDGFKQTDPGQDPKLLDDLKYLAGWRNCYLHFKQLLDFFLSADKKALRKYAGKPNKLKE